MLRHFFAPLSLLATLSLTACDTASSEDGETEGETGGEQLSHAADIQPIWDANCVSGCHSPGGLGMPLDLTDGHAGTVGVASSQAPDVNYIEAGSAADSYLVAKLQGTHLDMGGSGAQMPLNQDPLDAATIGTIEAWIDAGAPE